VYGAAKRAVERAREGGGVTLIEVLTYRRKGHAQHDPHNYVDPAEVEHWATTNDPIDRYVAALTQNGWATTKELAAIDGRIGRELDEMIAAVEPGPLPDAAEARTDVVSGGPVAAPWYRLSPPDPTKA
jgi:TPP-dependent pyruvate/acetoin dehydrogenase alpha subunit